MNRIKEVLERQGRSQKWLASKIGRSNNSVNSYVQNRTQPSMELLYLIAETQEIDIKELIISNKKMA